MDVPQGLKIVLTAFRIETGLQLKAPLDRSLTALGTEKVGSGREETR